MNNSIRLTTIFIFIVVLASCSLLIEKRRYMPGYHVSMVKKTKTIITQHRDNPIIEVGYDAPKIVNGNVEIPLTQVPNVSQKRTMTVNKSHDTHGKKFVAMMDDNCDEIVLFNGQKVLAKVEHIGEKDIRYKKCDDLKGLTYQLRLSQVSHINLSNGDVFQPKRDKPVNVDAINRRANTTFIMSIVGASLAVISLIFAFLIYPFPLIAFIISMIDIFYSLIVGTFAVKPHSNLRSVKTRLTLFFAFLITLVILILALILIFV